MWLSRAFFSVQTFSVTVPHAGDTAPGPYVYRPSYEASVTFTNAFCNTVRAHTATEPLEKHSVSSRSRRQQGFKIEVGAERVVVIIDKRAHNSYLVAFGLAETAPRMPWFGNKQLHIRKSRPDGWQLIAARRGRSGSPHC